MTGISERNELVLINQWQSEETSLSKIYYPNTVFKVRLTESSNINFEIP